MEYFLLFASKLCEIKLKNRRNSQCIGDKKDIFAISLTQSLFHSFCRAESDHKFKLTIFLLLSLYLYVCILYVFLVASDIFHGTSMGSIFFAFYSPSVSIKIQFRNGFFSSSSFWSFYEMKQTYVVESKSIWDTFWQPKKGTFTLNSAFESIWNWRFPDNNQIQRGYSITYWFVHYIRILNVGDKYCILLIEELKTPLDHSMCYLIEARMLKHTWWYHTMRKNKSRKHPLFFSNSSTHCMLF